MDLRKNNPNFKNIRKKKDLKGVNKDKLENLYGSKCEPWDNEMADSNFWEHYY